MHRPCQKLVARAIACAASDWEGCGPQRPARVVPLPRQAGVTELGRVEGCRRIKAGICGSTATLRGARRGRRSRRACLRSALARLALPGFGAVPSFSNNGPVAGVCKGVGPRSGKQSALAKRARAVNLGLDGAEQVPGSCCRWRRIIELRGARGCRGARRSGARSDSQGWRSCVCTHSPLAPIRCGDAACTERSRQRFQ